MKQARFTVTRQGSEDIRQNFQLAALYKFQAALKLLRRYAGVNLQGDCAVLIATQDQEDRKMFFPVFQTLGSDSLPQNSPFYALSLNIEFESSLKCFEIRFCAITKTAFRSFWQIWTRFPCQKPE